MKYSRSFRPQEVPEGFMKGWRAGGGGTHDERDDGVLDPTSEETRM